MQIAFVQKLIVGINLISFALLWSCNTSQKASNMPRVPDNTFLIPGPGIQARFNTPPEVFHEQSSTTFDVAYTFSSVQPFNDTATYFQGIGIFAHANGDTASLMAQGLQEFYGLLKPEDGYQLLLKEQTIFNGLPAWRFKFFSPPNPQMGTNGFYISVIAFVKAAYFVQLVVFNAQTKGKSWDDHSFFNSIEFTGPVEPGHLVHRDACSGYLCHNMERYSMPMMYFLGAARYFTQTVGSYQVQQFQSIPPQGSNNPILMSGVDVYQNAKDIATVNSLTTTQKGSVFPNGKLEVIAQENILLKGQQAIWLQIKAETSDSMGEIIYFSGYYVFFKRDNHVFSVFTYFTPNNRYGEQIKTCFLDWAGLLVKP